jgi:hypothetical protein
MTTIKRAAEVTVGFIQVAVGTALITAAALIAMFKALPTPERKPYAFAPAIHTKVAPPKVELELDCKHKYKTPQHPSYCIRVKPKQP